MDVTMKNIGYGNWGGWIGRVGVLMWLLALIAAQPGFLSIDCGGKQNHTDENNITWVNDINYIDVGQTGDIGAYSSFLHNLRFFPRPLNKSCYQLPVAPNVSYLLRTWFAIGNYSGFQQLPISFSFSIETLGILTFKNITITDKSPMFRENIFASSGRELYVCLIRSSESDDPLINAIELRTLRDGMYGQAKPRTMFSLNSRTNVGGNSTMRDWSRRKKLSEKNLTGSVPEPIAQLKAPVNLYSEAPGPVQHSGPPSSNKKKLKDDLGIAVGGILIMATIAGIVLYCKRKKRVTTESNRDRVGKEQKGDAKFSSSERMNFTVPLPNPKKSCSFTRDEMMAATQKFSGTIGKGSFGSVFFGKLPEGKNVAVKVLSMFSKQGVYQFLNEIDVLSRVHHKNLVSLLGYCNESKELMLIYEYMSGGSLMDRLYGNSELNWKSRLKIALDAACGLQYMHLFCIPRIIHRDIKTANILLDSTLNGKLGDFGLSRIWIDGEVSHVTTMVKGTAGYLDPEYFSTEKLTEKSDIYSFGVVLLEIICGRPPIDATLSVDKRNITRWVTPFIEMETIPGQIDEIIDKRLGGNYSLESITRVAKVACRCAKAEPFYRPSVSEVVAELIEAIKLEDKASLSDSEQIDIKCEDL